MHFFIGVTKWLDSRALTGKNHWKLRWCGVAMAEKLSVRPQALREVGGAVNSGRGSTRLAYSLSLPRTTDSLSSSRSSSSSAKDLISSTSSMRSRTSFLSRIRSSPPQLRLPSLTCDWPVSKCRASPILITDLLVSLSFSFSFSFSLSFSQVFAISRSLSASFGLSLTFYLSFSRSGWDRFGDSSCDCERESLSCCVVRVRSADVRLSIGEHLPSQKAGSGLSWGWLGKCVRVKRSGWGLQLPEQLVYRGRGCQWGGGKGWSKRGCSWGRGEESCFQEQLEAVRWRSALRETFCLARWVRDWAGVGWGEGLGVGRYMRKVSWGGVGRLGLRLRKQ